MPGQRLAIDSRGTSYEDCVRLLMGRFASLVHVPREQDFGIDFYVQPRVGAERQTESVAELAAIQVKGGSAVLRYGGVNARGKWRHHELTWLRALVTPLYLARVDARCSGLELFSLWPVWLIFWQQRELPFEIRFTTRDAASTAAWEEPVATPHPKGHGKGDGQAWTVDLGRPLLQLSVAASDDTQSSALQAQVLRAWILNDRANLIRFQQFIPVLSGITEWRTGTLAPHVMKTWQFWAAEPGENIARLSETAAPLVVNLGIHLQWQNDEAAYALLPLLQWFCRNGRLDQIGLGLLSGLESSHAAGLGPGEGIRRQTENDKRPNRASLPTSRARRTGKATRRGSAARR